jgi:hypothetical protein
MKHLLFTSCACCLVFISCNNKIAADLIVYNARIYTVDTAFSTAEALAVKDGKILATGSSKSILEAYDATEKTDAQEKIIYPGFIDAHAHFYNYAQGLNKVSLVGTSSWEEILQLLSDAAKKIGANEWLIGRGWDQNDWQVKEFPSNEKLNELFPNIPVMLTRVDGHAAIANQKALDIAGIKAGDKMAGGLVEVKNGKMTGMLVDNAAGKLHAAVPAADIAHIKAGLAAAQKNCFAVGLTSVDDCGLDAVEIAMLDSLQKSGDLKMRIYAMLSDAKENYEYIFQKGKIKTERLHVAGFKVYADGALGSRGACLLQPYSDKPQWSGFLLNTAAHFDSVAALIYAKGFQMCTHAIGDSGNRIILHTYAKYLKGKNDLRWRIEHAQVINENDFGIFAANSIIPSVQPTHATSDMYWAAERLGNERIKGAYAYQQLLQQNGWIALGTDFPVEDISPFKTFYAAVVRKDAKGWPADGFQTSNALSRENALRGMTIWAAKANFEEQEKGSLEKGKFADFIILDQDLLKAAPEKLLTTKLLATYLNGEKVY